MMLLCETAPLFAADLDIPEIQLENVTITDRLDTTTYLPKPISNANPPTICGKPSKAFPVYFRENPPDAGKIPLPSGNQAVIRSACMLTIFLSQRHTGTNGLPTMPCCSILNPSTSPKVFRLRFSEAITGWREQSISKRRNQSKIWISRPNIRIISTAIPAIRDA